MQKINFSIININWNSFWFREASYYPLLLYRFLVFFVGAVYLYWIGSSHPPSFYEKWDPISFYHLLSGPLNPEFVAAVKVLWLVFSLLAGANVMFSVFGKLAALSGVFCFGYDYNFGHVFHGTHVYIMASIILSFSKVDRSKELSPEHRWPIALCAAYVVYVMTLCGFQKLYYGDGLRWIFSESFYLRLLISPTTTTLNQWIMDSPLWVSQVMAFWGIIITEVSSPLFLFRKRSRYIIFFLWAGFHFMVLLGFSSHRSFMSQVYIYLAILPMEDWTPYIKPFCDLFLIRKNLKSGYVSMLHFGR